MKRILTLGLAVAALATAAGLRAIDRQQPAAPPSGLLMGVIVDAADARPVPDATVTLAGLPSPVEVVTDSEGRFVFMDLPRGTFTLTAFKPGYSQGAFGRRRPNGSMQPVTLTDAERLGDLRIPIWKLGVITGRIVDEAGEPLIGVSVTTLQRTVVAGNRRFTPGPRTRTDDRGIYRISSLTPGDYAVVVASTQATMPLSIVDIFQQQRAPIARPGESSFARDLQMTVSASDFALFERHSASRVGTLAFLSTGGGVLAGTAPPFSADGRAYVYPTRFYPAASTAADAGIITLRSGEERTNVDLQLTPVPTSRVSGVVTGPDGPVVAALSLVPDTEDLSTSIGFETATTMSDASGRFTFIGVPPGRHHLRAVWISVPVGGGGSRGAPPPPKQPAPPAPPLSDLGGYTLWAAQPITVGVTDVNDLAVTMRPGFRLGGRAQFVGATARPAPDVIRRMSATLDPADGKPLPSSIIGRGQFDENGRLTTYQLPPGRYYIRINNAPAGWMLKSAVANGRDISNLPVTLDRDVPSAAITLTDRPASLAGQVHTTQGAPDAAATVLLFPSDTTLWSDTGGFPRKLREVRVGRDGRFRVTDLPPGDYLAVAIPEESSENWQDRAVLQALARLATAFALTDGEARSLTLVTAMVKR